MPGITNTFSITTVPAMRAPSCRVPTVTRETEAFRTPWTRAAPRRVRPLAMAVRMKSSPITSSMAERT